MSKALELWKWIELVELKYTMNDRMIPYKYIDVLMNKIKIIEPELKATRNTIYTSILNDNFADKFALKLMKTPEDKIFMLFDFIKNLIHECLLKKDLYDVENNI